MGKSYCCVKCGKRFTAIEASTIIVALATLLVWIWFIDFFIGSVDSPEMDVGTFFINAFIAIAVPIVGFSIINGKKCKYGRTSLTMKCEKCKQEDAVNARAEQNAHQTAPALSFSDSNKGSVSAPSEPMINPFEQAKQK
jgi:hypothetical protein